jgi:hypothetical protein
MHWFDELAEEKENHQHTYKAVLEVLYESTVAAETGLIARTALTVTEYVPGPQSTENLVCNATFFLSPTEVHRSLLNELGWKRTDFLTKVGTLYRDTFEHSRPETILGTIVACTESGA